MKGVALSAAACAAAVILSGCSALGAPGTGPGGTDLLEAMRSMSARCTGMMSANLTFAPPLPPSGSLVMNQTCSGPPADGPPVSTPSSQAKPGSL